MRLPCSTALALAALASAAMAAEPVSTETKRAGRTGADIVLGSYVSVDKACKVGDPPRVDVTAPPAHGQVLTRPQGVNLRAAPGAPNKNCIGLSPNGVAVIYRSARRYKGEDAATFQVVFPESGVREVKAAITVK